MTIAGNIGIYQYILFDIAPNVVSGKYRSTFYGEIDVVACNAASANYGTGLAGKNGIPTLTVDQSPVIASKRKLLVSNSSGTAANALILVGVQSGSFPAVGGRLLVVPLVQTFVNVPSAGLVLPFTVPSQCLSVYLQVLQLDSAAIYGISMTPGLRLDLGL